MNQQKQVGKEISKKKRNAGKYKIEQQYIFSNKSYDQVNNFLREYRNIDLESVRDQKGNTALHQAAFHYEDIKLLKRYLDYMEVYCSQEFTNPRDRFKEFLDSENQDGLTALHFAAYKGNFKALQMLCNHGADYTRQTKSGQNVLHLAAQGGMVETFIYFQSLIDINCQDKKKSTPLHWASYMNNQSIVSFLVAQPNIQVNVQDEKLQTPLHLATAYGHTKIVKKLLRAGADRKLLNEKYQDALKIAKDNQFRNIERILDDNYTCIDHFKLYFNLKTVYKPEGRSYSMPALFIFSMALVIFLRIFLLQLSEGNQFVSYIEYGFYGLIYLSYLSLIAPPRKLRPQKYIDFLNGSVNMKKICLICANPKPIRSVHCDICKKCIQRYDHHCFWINNCVGRHNLGRFISFIILFQLFLFYVIGLTVLVLMQHYTQEKSIIHAREDRQIYGIIYVYGIGIFSFFFSFPTLGLIVVHLKNLLLNKTTYQRFTKDKISTLTESTSHLLEQQMKTKKRTQYSLSNAFKMCSSKLEESENENINSSISLEN